MHGRIHSCMCHECGQVLKELSPTQHQKTNSGETPFKCDHHGNAFRRSLLEIRELSGQRIHLNVRRRKWSITSPTLLRWTRGPDTESVAYSYEKGHNPRNHRAGHKAHAVNVRKSLITQMNPHMTQVTKPRPSTRLSKYHEIHNKDKPLEIQQVREIPFWRFKFYYISEYIKLLHIRVY